MRTKMMQPRGLKLCQIGINGQWNVWYASRFCLDLGFTCFDLWLSCNITPFVVLSQAKVLEEKNMRDLLAQKEQAERNVRFGPDNP